MNNGKIHEIRVQEQWTEFLTQGSRTMDRDSESEFMDEGQLTGTKEQDH
jgi:hypothetical protein